MFRYSLSVALCLFSPALFAQLTLSLQQIDLKMPENGPLPPTTQFQITTSGAWTATLSQNGVVNLDKTQAAGNSVVVVTPVVWRAPGTYNTTITVSAQGTNRSIPVKLTVVAKQQPEFIYLDGPHDCKDEDGFFPGNAADCTVPNERPPGSFVPPDVGGTYIDPNFGSQVHIIAGPTAFHGYSTPSPISATNQYALVSINGKTTVIELLTGKPVRTPKIRYEGTAWDSVNDNFLYTFQGATVLRYDVSSDKLEPIAQYSRFSQVTPRGTAEISKDNWLSFVGMANGTQTELCTLDLNTSTTYCGAIPKGTLVDYPTMSKGVDQTSGERYVLGITTGGGFLLYTVNEQQGLLNPPTRGPENVLMNRGDHDGICEQGEVCVNGSHSDTMEDENGNQFLVMRLEGQSPCEMSAYSLQLNKGDQMGLAVETGGGLKKLMRMFRCGGQDRWVDSHTACAKFSPTCVLSITISGFNQARDPNDTSPIKRTAYMGEIVLLHNNGAEVRRLAEHRSVQFKNEDGNGYWSTPRGALSGDARYVLATSNFGEPNQQRVILIDTGLIPPSLAAGDPVLNGASYLPKIAPENLAIAFGDQLSPCVESATFPLPEQLCNVHVRLDGIAARIFSVHPKQVAFLVPPQIHTGTDLQLEVETTPFGGQSQILQATIPAENVVVTEPAIFATTIPQLPFNAALLFTPDWQQQPLHVGEIGILFAVGLGATNPPVGYGEPSPSAEPLARNVSPPALYINDVRQSLLYAGLVPGMSSVYQIVFTIDQATTIQNFNWIWLNSGGVESPRLLMQLLPPA